MMQNGIRYPSRYFFSSLLSSQSCGKGAILCFILRGCRERERDVNIVCTKYRYAWWYRVLSEWYGMGARRNIKWDNTMYFTYAAIITE